MRCIAVIVENRNIYNLNGIIEGHLKHLGGWEYRRINDPSIKTLNDYNRLMTSESFWEQWQDYQRVLIFQSDSMILRDGIDEFLKWHYCGAPWKFQHQGGNGGLSLRHPGKCLELVKKRPWSISYGYEDVYFSNYLEEVGARIAPREVNKKFSCETIFEMGTLGYHAIDKYFSKQQCEMIKNQYIANETVI